VAEGTPRSGTAEEAQEETMRMLACMQNSPKLSWPLPVLRGEKTAAERFPGAEATYSVEALS